MRGHVAQPDVQRLDRSSIMWISANRALETSQSRGCLDYVWKLFQRLEFLQLRRQV